MRDFLVGTGLGVMVLGACFLMPWLVFVGVVMALLGVV